MKTFEEVKAFFVKSFPQIDFSTFVTDEEIARFATSDSGMFPEPQYIKGIQQLFKEQKKGKNYSKYCDNNKKYCVKQLRILCKTTVNIVMNMTINIAIRLV